MGTKRPRLDKKGKSIKRSEGTRETKENESGNNVFTTTRSSEAKGPRRNSDDVINNNELEGGQRPEKVPCSCGPSLRGFPHTLPLSACIGLHGEKAKETTTCLISVCTPWTPF